jgi:hypothetical protein
MTAKPYKLGHLPYESDFKPPFVKDGYA